MSKDTSIENHGSFCNIYQNGGIAFGTKDYGTAKSKLKEYDFDIDTLPLFVQGLKDGTCTLKLNPVVEFLYPESREDIKSELLSNVPQ